MRKFIYTYFLVLGFIIVNHLQVVAQELRCNVKINASSNQIASNVGTINDTQIFTEMQRAMTQFMNNTRWTNDNFKDSEKINCNIVITITAIPGVGQYEAQAIIQSSRPVYGTDYESVVMSFVDRAFRFTYNPGEQMNYNEAAFTSNLVSMLSFYANIIIGLDYDTFSKVGGTAYLQKAAAISTLASQESNDDSWKPNSDTRSRYWLGENLNSPQMQSFREGLYTYYRVAIDNYAANGDQARSQILTFLNNVKQINQIRPNSIWTNTFFDTKSNELINIFSEGNPQDKVKAYNLLVELDPTKADRYRKLTR
ncbi:DUF4835 family protein [Xanthocytophaga agilis]|uniref:DUF4835 family protein n=1 Tax=Xanthocytophaga agilis TaxID=3048010 RepID=A0AAE3R3U2_9BACT|nr:DUF4835 family protein [Xanthocytophaga agilis]MDJ1500859.1 DUF4835 family protein [Xanthocytophaga agilis]